MKVIAHRGAPTEALENSFSAFDRALSAKADRIELDTHLTADKKILIIHDENLSRTSDSSLNVSELSINQLADIKLNNGEPIPLLEQVITKYLHHLELNIELKSGGPSLVDAVVESLPPHEQRKNAIIISSFDVELLRYTAKHYPKETLALLWEEKDLSKVHDIMSECECNIFHPEVKIIDEELMKFTSENQWQVFPYISIKDEKPPETIWKELSTLGIDGLCTNYPREFKAWLEANDGKN